MARVPNISTATPTSSSTVLGETAGVVRRFAYAAPISVTHYASLVFTHTAKDPGDAASHYAASFSSWRLAIQAALDDATARGGGTVVVPGAASAYLIDDTLTVYDNTRLVFEGEVKLGDYTTGGHILMLDGDNIQVVNPLLDGSGIYAGGSGQNGLVGSGTNHKVIGGRIKNCARGNAGPMDGGKAVQYEGTFSDVIVEGTTFESCFMAMSSSHDLAGTDPCGPILFSNVTAKDCEILLFAGQSNGADTSGQEHTVTLDGFTAKNCGSFEGVMQFSRAANVLVANGTITNSASVEALIRGNHRFCRFENIQFAGDCDALIDLDPSTYAVDSSYQPTNNTYDIAHSGTAGYIAWADPLTTYRTLDDCDLSARLQNDVTTKIVGDELRNGDLRLDVRQGSKSICATSATLYLESKAKFADFAAGINLPYINNIKIGTNGTWTPTDVSGAGLVLTTGTGFYTKVGRQVTATFTITFPATADGSNANIGGLPVASMGAGQVTDAAFLRYTDYGAHVYVVNSPGTAAVIFQTLGGAVLSNAQLSGKTVQGTMIYFAD